MILKKQTLWILSLLPAFMVAQDGPVIRIDLNKNKKKTVEKQQTPSMDENVNNTEQEEKMNKRKKGIATEENETFRYPEERDEDPPDFRKGLFRGLFIAGLNACQVDGDDDAGYKYLGAHVGIGALVKFHKHMSVSMELLYNMKGAQRRLFGNLNADSTFRLVHDYVQVPILFNVHDKRIVIFSAGISFGYMVRFRQIINGTDYTNPDHSAPIAPQFIQPPRRFDLCGEAGLHFVVKDRFAFGGRFSYSLIGMRDALPATRVSKQFNNVITFRFMYLLLPNKK
ncbi:MAG: porin family protein [Chitinophagales bacterium]|nr:PorT family protein [Chitinophagales bacterium]MDW8273326.1 porin family protein [Chitinophagales bacterium]